MKIAITLTTINIPDVVKKIAHDYDGAHELFFVVAGDVNSADGTDTFLSQVEADSGLTVVYIHPSDLSFASGFNRSLEHIPTKSFAQRNYADLRAVQLGAEVIIRIDDDNFPFDATSFVDNHVARLLHTGDVELVSADNGWFNCCDMLEERNGLRFYPRGFPVLPRHQEQSVTVANSTGLKIGVNAGLWLGDPDIDAHQRLAHPIEATKFSANYSEDLLIAKGVWCPINTQNTAYLAELLPVMFVSPFAGRYDDIISGYLMRAVLDVHDIFVSYGNPLVFQDRNPHNLVSDLRNELNGMTISDELTGHLMDFAKDTPAGSSLADTYLTVLEKLKSTSLYKTSEFLRVIVDGSQWWCADHQDVYG